DTFAAVALATAYLHDVSGVDEKEAVVVCPVDPYVDEEYFKTIHDMCIAAQNGDENLVLMGIEPTYPSEEYGYIKPTKNESGQKVWSFTEKPDEEKARQYINEGALWNGGVIAYKLKYVLEKAKDLLGTCDYNELVSNYDSLNKISFDYAVTEKETNINVLTYRGTWKDLGTWNILTEVMDETTVGNVHLNDACENVNVINELNIPILVMGGKDMVVVASPDGILVSDKEQSSDIKPFVNKIQNQIMCARKSWGTYQVIDVSDFSMTVKLTLKPNHHMSYHSHEKRDETWTVIDGFGKTIIDGAVKTIQIGDFITMPVGSKHTVIAGEKGLQLIEMQIGKDINVKDKKKYDWPL
ncbi:MAG: cupin domain-containing protein, partial [Faecalicoccus sp.]|nr:cupin domain-containing protein [Faecalicoccus sp.]